MSKNSSYPLNLLDDIWAIHDHETETWDGDLPSDYVGTVEYLICTALTEREAEIVHKYYRDGRIFNDIAKDYEVTRERIRQVQQHALRKLAHPKRVEWLEVGVVGMLQAERIKATEKAVNQGLNEVITAIQSVNNSLHEIVGNSPISAKIEEYKEVGFNLDTPIEECNFSVRTYNCMKRAGKDTVRQLQKMTYEQLTQIRNLGKKSTDEVVNYLHRQGLTLADETKGE